MKLVMTLVVRDDQDVIAANLDFHLSQGVDFFIATDHRSVDGTTEILRDYERKGVLHYIYQPGLDFRQDRWVTHMARMACTDFAADWVINNDADEFWWPEQHDLKHVLSKVPASYAGVVAERTNFLPRPMTDLEFFVDTMTVRWRRSLNPMGQPLPHKVCHRAFRNVKVSLGNHAAKRGWRKIRAAPAPITIFHFPMRSYRQFVNKVVKGGEAVQRNAPIPTWRWLYEKQENDELDDIWRDALLDEATINKGLREGWLVSDDRLKKHFAQLKLQSLP